MDSVIVFDMDGVLAEVTESYRESIVQTVRYFTGKTVSRDAIQDYKNQGGWNNDWALSQKIAADFGTQIDYDTVIEKFNEYLPGGERQRPGNARELVPATGPARTPGRALWAVAIHRPSAL